jgi:hypothetical protein
LDTSGSHVFADLIVGFRTDKVFDINRLTCKRCGG